MEGATPAAVQREGGAPQGKLVDGAARAASSTSGRLSAGEMERPTTEAGARAVPLEAEPATTERAAQPERPPVAAAGRARAGSSGAAGERVRPRVERLREASVVVFDEAAEDPGTRFVVVAVALFVVFLVIMLFSYALK